MMGLPMAKDPQNRTAELTDSAVPRLKSPMRGAEAVALARAQEGDAEAFRTLVEEHSRQMFRLAYRMTGNEHDAEDVVQETFLRAYSKLGRYDSRAQFSSWLYRIATNYAIDLLRRRKRWLSSEIDPVECEMPLEAETPGPEQSTYGSEIRSLQTPPSDTSASGARKTRYTSTTTPPFIPPPRRSRSSTICS